MPHRKMHENGAAIHPNRKRIVHVITRFIRGGADENTLYTVNGQASFGHDVHLIAGDHHPDMVGQLHPNVSFHHETSMVREISPSRDFTCFLRLSSFFRRMRPDLVHTHESKAGILGRIAARRAKVPTVIHGIHILPFVDTAWPASSIYLLAERIAARHTHAYIDVSAGMRELALNYGLGTADSHFVIESGMDLAAFRGAAPIALGELGICCDGPRPVIGLISGTLERRKRIAEFIEALGEVPIRGANWHLLIAGEGRARSSIEATVREAGLDGKVHLLGYRDDLARLIATSDLCVHAAGNEGLPRVVVQYVLGGRPVVATALPGLERVVEDGVNGSIVGSLPSLAHAFVSLVNDAKKRQAMARNSAERGLGDWDRARMVDRIMEVYDGFWLSSETLPASAALQSSESRA